MEQGKYALENLELFLNKLGYDKCILQHDAEHVGAGSREAGRSSSMSWPLKTLG